VTHVVPATAPGLRDATAAIFPGSGEMASRCRAFDWASTALGPVSGWSHSLQTTVGIMLASRNPMFLFWGPELVQVYNDAYRPSLGEAGRHPAALGMRGADFWTDIWTTIGPQIEQVMSRGEATWHEDQYLPIIRNGRLEDVWWTYSYSPVFDDDGGIGGTLVVCLETTQRVLADRERQRLLDETARAEAALAVERARLAYIFQRAPSFLAVLRGPEFVFELANEAYYNVVGHRELIGRPVLDALPEVRDQGFETLLSSVIESGEPYIGREIRVDLARTPDGPLEERFVDFAYIPIIEADGTRSGIIAHGTDVTEQVMARREVERLLQESERARAEAEEARADAEAANRAKGEFLAVMSHELRTPLNAIGGYAELMEMGIRGPVSPAQLDDLRRIQTSQRHLLGLINEVLNYAKLETGSVQYALEEVRVREALMTADSLVAPQARAKGLRLDVADVPAALTVRADSEKLRQILVNLLSNAVKFTDRGGRIEMSCVAGDGSVDLRVRDTGIGIPADKLDAIFDPFVQVRSDLTRPHEGTGLGLAISRDLARGMGGDLFVESVVGDGSTFTLRIPRS
jgi:PAS domain S-box-containing protein